MLRRQQQADILDIAEAAGDLLYGPGIDDSVCWKKKFYQGFILIENFKRVYFKTAFSKSVDTISQKLMHWSFWNFTHFFYTY